MTKEPIRGNIKGNEEESYKKYYSTIGAHYNCLITKHAFWVSSKISSYCVKDIKDQNKTDIKPRVIVLYTLHKLQRSIICSTRKYYKSENKDEWFSSKENPCRPKWCLQHKKKCLKWSHMPLRMNMSKFLIYFSVYFIIIRWVYFCIYILWILTLIYISFY